MAEPISIQQLKDASLDVKSLEEVVNGDENVVVTTRLGETYPSVKGSIKKVFEVGGLPAVPFKTKALMTASALVDNQYAMVTDDTVNNGLYVKEAGAWVKSDYDPLSKSVEYTDHSISNKVTKFLRGSNTRGVAFAWVDTNDNVLLAINNDGSINYQGSHLSLQHTLELLNNTVAEKTDPIIVRKVLDELFRLSDSNDEPLVRLKNDGGLYISGIQESVQSILKKVSEPIVPIPYSKTEANFYNSRKLVSAFLDRLDTARAIYPDIAPVPNFAAMQDFTIGASWVDTVTITTGSHDNHVVMSGYENVFKENIGVVHPQVWSYNSKVAGFKYWLALNPYTNGNENIELPFIYGSNDPDFKEWELIPTFPQPFEADPVDEDGSNRGHLSDSGFCYDPKTGDLIYLWRKNLYFPAGSPVAAKIILRASNFDGKLWSDVYTIYEEPLTSSGVADGVMSPNIVYNPADDLFYMYSTQSGILWYRTTDNIHSANWTAKTACVFSNPNAKVWHLDIKFIGDKLVALFHSDNFMTGGNDAFYFGVSSDFTNFTVSQNSIITNPVPEVYKATFEPLITADNNAVFRIIYTSDSQSNPQYQMYVTDSNQINLGV